MIPFAYNSGNNNNNNINNITIVNNSNNDEDGTGNSTPPPSPSFQEPQNDDAWIEMVFSKQFADRRKTWLQTYNSDSSIDYETNEISVSTFLRDEYVHYSASSVRRAIPSAVDGLKPSQRKALFACFKRKLTKEIKVAQLVGYISEHTAYHHGEQSMEQTVVKLAQDFVGSNNINLLFPGGQFGSRLMGGKDAASSRYIFTRLAEITRAIFPVLDDDVLEYLDDEGICFFWRGFRFSLSLSISLLIFLPLSNLPTPPGTSIEPKYYIPIVPLVLINGCDGIGTGWSTKIPNYNPFDVINHVRAMIQGVEEEELKKTKKKFTPFYFGFRGDIVEQSPNKYVSRGIVKIEDEGHRFVISELPIGTWTQDMKDRLEDLLAQNYSGTTGTKNKKKNGKTQPAVKKKKKNPKLQITGFREYHTETTVHFDVDVGESTAKLLGEDEQSGLKLLMKELRLESSMSTSNMHLWSDDNTTVKKFKTIEEIMNMHYRVRLECYKKRIKYQIRCLREEFRKLNSQVRFIRAVLKNKLELRRKKSLVIADLESKFKNPSLYVEKGDERSETRFDYLLKMPLYSLTNENVADLEKKCSEKQKELDVMLRTKPQTVWLNELNGLENMLKERQRKVLEERKKALVKMSKQVDKSEAKRRKDRKRRRQNKEKKKKKKELGRNDSIVSIASTDFSQDFVESQDDAALQKKKKKKVLSRASSIASVSTVGGGDSSSDDEKLSLLELKAKLLKEKKTKVMTLVSDDDDVSDEGDIYL